MLDVLKHTVEEVEAAGETIQGRVPISFAVREIATFAEAGHGTLGVMHELVRFIKHAGDEAAKKDRMRPKLIECDLEESLRVHLHKEMFVKTYLGNKVRSLAETDSNELLEELKFMDDFLCQAAASPITSVTLNHALADFSEAMNGPRYFQCYVAT